MTKIIATLVTHDTYRIETESGILLDDVTIADDGFEVPDDIDVYATIEEAAKVIAARDGFDADEVVVR